MDYTHDYRPKIPLVFEPSLPPRDLVLAHFVPDHFKYNAEAQSLVLRHWQKIMTESPATEDEVKSGAWGCNTEKFIIPLFNFISGKWGATQRDATLATNFVMWLATMPGQAYAAEAQDMRDLFEEQKQQMTADKWPERGTPEDKRLGRLYEWATDSFSMVWARHRDLRHSGQLGYQISNGCAFPQGISNEQFIAASADDYVAGSMATAPEITAEDRRLLAGIIGWLGTAPDHKSYVKNLVSGQVFLQECRQELAVLTSSRPEPVQSVAASVQGPAL